MRAISALLFFTPLLLLSGCDSSGKGQTMPDIFGGDNNAGLEEAAIKAGVIVDPDELDLAGFYSRDQDRFCARGDPVSGRYKVGIMVSYGQDSQCEARGTALMRGEEISLQFNQGKSGALKQSCRLSAWFDGKTLELQGTSPAECNALCSPRASLAGVSLALSSPGNDQSGQAKGRAFEQLCPE